MTVSDRKTVSTHKTDEPAFSQADWDEVSDNPDLTDAELAALRPARELPPDISAALPRHRGGGAPPPADTDTARGPGIDRRRGSDRGAAVAAGPPFPPPQDAEAGPSGRKKA